MTARPDASTNALLDFSGLPRFDAITPSDVQPAIDLLLANNRALVERLTSDEVAATWSTFAAPLADDKAMRESAEYATLTPAQRKIVDNEIRDFRLSGAELPEDQKPRFQAISEELASLSAKFSENLLDATNAFAQFVTDDAKLAGIPDDVRQAAREAAEKDGKSGWKFTLHMPSYLPVMQYAEDRELRATMYRAYATRAAEFGPTELDNTPLITKILELRQEEARMPRWPNRSRKCSPSCAIWRRRPNPSPKRTSPNCARLPRRNSDSTRSNRGMSVSPRRNYCRRATPFPSRK
jgi:oligopeptidase A